MNLQEIVDAARNKFNNYEKPYLHHDDEMVEYVNNACDIICRDARLVKRNFSSAASYIYTTAGDNSYAIDSQVSAIISAYLCTQETILLNVAPATAWAVGDTITGDSSGTTSLIAEVISTTEFIIKNRSGAYTAAETLTNGTAPAIQTGLYPLVYDHETKELTKTSLSDIKKTSDWEYHLDEPIKYLLDVTHGSDTNRYLYLYPTPDEIYVVRLAVIGYLSAAMTTTSMSTQTPAIEPRYHSIIVDGVVYQMYLKRGDDTWNEKAADIYFKKFRNGIHDIKKEQIAYEGIDTIVSPHRAFI